MKFILPKEFEIDQKEVKKATKRARILTKWFLIGVSSGVLVLLVFLLWRIFG